MDSVIYDNFHAALLAALGQLNSHPQMFAIIFINFWSASRSSYFLSMINDVFTRKSRNFPLIISSENVQEDKLKKWLCLIESRESDALSFYGSKIILDRPNHFG